MAKLPGKPPIFLLDDLGKGTSVGKIVLKNAGEERAREGGPFNSVYEVM